MPVPEPSSFSTLVPRPPPTMKQPSSPSPQDETETSLPLIRAWTYTQGVFPAALQQSLLPTTFTNHPPLKPTELLVRVRAASLNPVDAQMMGFPLWPYLPNFIIPAVKGVGEDFSGIVLTAGLDTGFTEGDEVFGIGPFLPTGTVQEIVRIDTGPGGGAVVLKKPAGWSWEQAASLPLVWITARTTVGLVEPYVTIKNEGGGGGGGDDGGKKPGKVVVLGGSSSCGMYAVLMARRRGWRVLATCSGRNVEFVRSLGADVVVDYTNENVRDAVARFEPDAIIDMVGGTECLGLAGRYVTVVGDKTNRMTMGGRNIYLWNPRMALRAVMGRVGLGRSYTCVNLDVRRENLEDVVELPEEKIVIDSVFGFDEVREAFERLNTGRTRGKVVIKMPEA